MEAVSSQPAAILWWSSGKSYDRRALLSDMDIVDIVVVGTILGVGAVLVALGWRFLYEFRKAARDD